MKERKSRREEACKEAEKGAGRKKKVRIKEGEGSYGKG